MSTASLDQTVPHTKPRCDVCRSSETDGVWPPYTKCTLCERAVQAYIAMGGDHSADPDFAYHEAAHFVVLFRRKPCSQNDLDLSAKTIARFGIGQAQIHEIRTITLQFITYRDLGWRPSIELLVDLNWPGIEDAPWMSQRGKDLVRSKTALRRRMRAMLSQISQRNVQTYTSLLRQWRGEKGEV